MLTPELATLPKPMTGLTQPPPRLLQQMPSGVLPYTQWVPYPGVSLPQGLVGRYFPPSLFPVVNRNLIYCQPASSLYTLSLYLRHKQWALVIWSLPLVGFDISSPFMLSGFCRSGLGEHKSMPIPA